MCKNQKKVTLRVKSWLLTALLVFGLVTTGMPTGQATFAETLRAAIMQVEPYGFLTEDGRITGIHYDILTRLSEEVGFSLEARLAPFARVLLMIKSAKADMTLMYLNESIEQSAVIVGPFSLARNVVFGRPGSKYCSLKDLHGKEVASLRGANYDDSFTADAAIIKYPTSSYRQSLNMFTAGRLDAVVAPEHTILYSVKKMGLTSAIFGEPLVLNEKEAFLFFSKKTADDKTVADLKNVLKTMREQGVIKKIYDSYLK